MTILKMMLITVGVAFSLFGYLIYFKKQCDLINGFEEEHKAGRKTESYAKEIYASTGAKLLGINHTDIYYQVPPISERT